MLIIGMCWATQSMGGALCRHTTVELCMPVSVEAGALRDYVAGMFVAAGLDPNAAKTVAASLVDADQLGLSSHGVMLADMYLKRLQAGSVSLLTKPDLVSEQGVGIVLDGRNAFGVLVADVAMDMAIAKAREQGAGIVAVRHAFHFGAARRFAEAAARADCVGIAMCNTRPLMPAPGGAERVVGNNPIAIAIPTDDTIPLVLDMATSEAAMGKIRMAAKRGEVIPSNWAVQADGSATTDPQAAIAGMLLPSAGPKGYGLALMIDMMCGLLSGGAFGAGVQPLYGDMEQPYDCAHLFIAIDLGHFTDPAIARAQAKAVAMKIRAGARAPDVDRLYTPGEREWLNRSGDPDTVTIDIAVLDHLAELAVSLGLEPQRLDQPGHMKKGA